MTKQGMTKLDKINKAMEDMNRKMLTVDFFVWLGPIVGAVCLLSYFFKWVTS